MLRILETEQKCNLKRKIETEILQKKTQFEMVRIHNNQSSREESDAHETI